MDALRSLLRGALGLVLLASIGCGGFNPREQTLEPEGEDVAAAASELDITVFTLPSAAPADRTPILAKYPSLDPTGMIPRGLLEDAIEFYDINKPYIPRPESFVVVDFAPFSGKDRFFLIDVATGVVEPHKVAHGDGTDPDNDGFADVFSNVSGSHMSSLGFYLTGEIYDGTHPHSMRIDGLSPDGSPNAMANTNVRDRLVVVHEASYVDDANTGQQGRSNGCFALDTSIEVGVVDRIHDGTMMYAAISPLNAPIGPVSGGTGGAGGGTSASSGTSASVGASSSGSSATTGAATSSSGAGGSGGSGESASSPTRSKGCSVAAGTEERELPFALAFAIIALGSARARRRLVLLSRPREWGC